jgi:hypothetical protein
MRPAKVMLVVAGLAAFSMGGCRRGMSAPRAALQWTTIAPDRVSAIGHHHWVLYGVKLPPELGRASAGRRVELRFQRPLDAAKVTIYGSGPGHQLAPLEERRVGGKILALALPPLTFDRLDIEVNNHLRPTPLPPEVRIGQEVR